jgi:general secretion pathway protein G
MGRQRGITLLELVVVLAIGGLLASIGIPAYQAAIERARVSQAVSDIGLLSIGVARWYTNTFTYPATLEEARVDNKLDPWGHPYLYLRISTATTGQVRRDRNLRPINSDFDLYSMGKDGETTTQLQGRKARDDVVRANDGGFLGLAKDY